MKINSLLLLFTLLIISIPNYLSGQITFSEQVISQALGGQDVLNVDIDDDGDEDLLVVSSYLKILFNDGAGNFTSSILPNINFVKAAQVSDIDSDGDWDIAVVSSFYDEVYWLENDGNENFTKHLISTVLNDPRNINAADFDGDGKIDIIASGYNDYEILWWKNDGNEQFTENTLDNNIARPLTVAIADMDNDNDLDIVTLSFHSSDIYWYRNNSNGVFSRIKIANFPGVLDLHLEDINGDNSVDIVAIVTNSSNINWYQNIGNGHSFVEHEIQDFNLSKKGKDIKALDMDKDGDIDIVVGYDRTQHTWHENDGNENFTTHFLDFGLYGLGIAVADIDQDTKIDLVYTDGYDIQWFKNDGNENYTSQNIIDNYYGFPRDIHATDMDNDGDIDIQTATTFSQSIGWWENDGNETFSYRKAADGFYSFVEIGDLDGDNDLDFVSSSGNSSSSGGGFVWLENDGTNLNFTSKIIQSYTVTAAAVADFDSDGDQDVASNRGNGELRWFSNDGTGNFSLNFIGNNSGNTPKINLGDIDSDGDLDLIKFNSSSQRLQHHLYSGNIFTTGYPYIDNNLTTCSKIESVDLDQDGDLDVMATSSSLKDVIWYKNDGNGNFQKNYLDENFTSANGLGWGDFDGDADLDIIVGGSTLSWFENDGSENFTKHDITNYYCGGELFIEDVNGDGKPDILAGSCGPGKTLVYWENTTTFPQPSVPNCTTYNLPEMGSDNIVNQVKLNWSEVVADSYKVYAGTDGGGIETPTNLVNSAVVNSGNSLIYDLNGLQPNTTYYWQIIPSNANGDATSCPIWSFETEGSNACTPCDTLYLPNTPFEGDSTFIACDSIISAMIIQNTSSVIYEAGQMIKLMPGFYANQGGEFTARIEDNCSESLSNENNEFAKNRKINHQTIAAKSIQEFPELTVFPNPINTQANIHFTLPKPSSVQITLYNLNGKQIQAILSSAHYEAGTHQLNWENKTLSSGLYLLHLTSNQGQIVKKVIII